MFAVRPAAERRCGGARRERYSCGGRGVKQRHVTPSGAKVEKVRHGGRVARKCVVIAHAVHETGRREIIGLDVGEAETEAFWTEFLMKPRRAARARAGLVG